MKVRTREDHAEYRARRIREAEIASANIAPPPPGMEWETALAEQAAKPDHLRYPYPSPAFVERQFMPSRPATWVPSASTLG